jgi:hypothetical protein
VFVLVGIASLLSSRIRPGEKGQAMEDAMYRVLRLINPKADSYRDFHEALRKPLSHLAIVVGVVLVVVGILR